MDNHLHIISFDIPYPANYGGIIDVFYKIKALNKKGIKIHLHCFEYGREHSEELSKYCFSINYYKRDKSFLNTLVLNPFIVSSRKSQEMIENLLKDDYPILFEGLHSCYYLDSNRLKNRFKMVRTHNIEHHYYSGLSGSSRNVLEKIYFIGASFKLRIFERKLKQANVIFPISVKDEIHFKLKFREVHYLPPFHQNDKMEIQPELGKYVLYHGNLQIKENEQAVLYLIESIFQGSDYPFIVAGSNPSSRIINAISKSKNITLKSDINDSRMLDLVSNAQINLLLSFQATGIKLKLINSLFLGRHVLVNPIIVKGTGLEKLCVIGHSASEFKKLIKKYMELPVEQEEIDFRKKILETKFNNESSASLFIKYLPSSL